ncbi:MAG: hypothetical protein KDI38_16220 [Calditrichaeota bacterium]|nr:hypothetical protein [Calditrichota bacterium]MCB0305310.1 hypothetical protein [Calditrichota bacterium]
MNNRTRIHLYVFFALLCMITALVGMIKTGMVLPLFYVFHSDNDLTEPVQ